MPRAFLLLAALVLPAVLAGCARPPDPGFASFADLLGVAARDAAVRDGGAFLVGASADEGPGDAALGDGRAAAWTIVHALPSAGELLCARVDAATRSVADSESRALPGRAGATAGHTAFLAAGLVPAEASSALDSGDAAAAARANATFARASADAVAWRVALVGVGEGGVWVVAAAGGASSATASVDAATGRVIHARTGLGPGQDAGCGA